MIAKIVPTIRTIEIGRTMNALGKKPAITYETNETPATVKA